MLARVVERAKRVLTPRVTRAGADLWSIQKANQETTTIMMQGTYMVTRK